MHRRKALKNIVLSLGYAITTPTVIGILNSCTNKEVKWISVFLKETQKHMISHLVEIILPKSEILGALDLNLPQFIDKIMALTVTRNEQNIFNLGSNAFACKFKSVYKKDALKGTRVEFNKLLDICFTVYNEEQQRPFNLIDVANSEIKGTYSQNFLIYKFLTEVRHYSLLGYYTSKEINEDVLDYNPIPGYYDGCLGL